MDLERKINKHNKFLGYVFAGSLALGGVYYTVTHSDTVKNMYTSVVQYLGGK